MPNDTIKPVASFFMSDKAPHINKIDFGVRGGKWKPLHYIPATHRIVPVELLRVAMSASYASDPALYDQLRAIIDKEPT